MTPDELRTLRLFCEWLDARPRKSAYSSELSGFLSLPPCPEEAQYWTFKQMRKQRKEASCFFWHTGWGWRLRKNWKERLEQLEKAIEESEEPEVH